MPTGDKVSQLNPPAPIALWTKMIGKKYHWLPRRLEPVPSKHREFPDFLADKAIKIGRNAQAPTQYGARKRFFSTLPAADMGKASANATVLGHL